MRVASDALAGRPMATGRGYDPWRERCARGHTLRRSDGDKAVVGGEVEGRRSLTGGRVLAWRERSPARLA